MLYNRIGFCALKPPRDYAGRPLRAQSPDGVVTSTLLDLIGPQRFENGFYIPLFPSVSRLEVDLENGPTTVFEFQGDLFETEDQRNWSDASFKTYCTPLLRGFPHKLDDGEELSQSVIVHAAGATRARRAPAFPKPEIGTPTGTRVPSVGLQIGSVEPSQVELGLLRALRLGHLRADIHLGNPSWESALARSLRICDSIGVELELALFLSAEETCRLCAMRSRLRRLLACSSRLTGRRPSRHRRRHRRTWSPARGKHSRSRAFRLRAVLTCTSVS